MMPSRDRDRFRGINRAGESAFLCSRSSGKTGSCLADEMRVHLAAATSHIERSTSTLECTRGFLHDWENCDQEFQNLHREIALFPAFVHSTSQQELFVTSSSNRAQEI